jgi:hypothetical protein
VIDRSRAREKLSAVKLRPVATVLGLAASAALLLSACAPKTGAAAEVDGGRISATSINDPVHAASADDISALGYASVAEQKIGARTLVLQYLVEEKLFSAALDKMGVHPSAADLAEKHDDAIQVLYASRVTDTGSAGDQRLAASLKQNGVDADFASHVLRAAELEAVFADEAGVDLIDSTSGAANASDIGPAVQKLGVKVSINPRYGTWSWDALGVDQVSLPGFLSLAPAAAA